eukprot:scaffold651880_cov32-Prasinocladus_malaysianus.AAC.1
MDDGLLAAEGSVLFSQTETCSASKGPAICALSFANLTQCAHWKLSAAVEESDFAGDGKSIVFAAQGSEGRLTGEECSSGTQGRCGSFFDCWSRADVTDLIAAGTDLTVYGVIGASVNCCCEPAMRVIVKLECCAMPDCGP